MFWNAATKYSIQTKQHVFARFGGRVISEAAAAESVSSEIWKMSCIDLVWAEISD